MFFMFYRGIKDSPSSRGLCMTFLIYNERIIFDIFKVLPLSCVHKNPQKQNYFIEKQALQQKFTIKRRFRGKTNVTVTTLICTN